MIANLINAVRNAVAKYKAQRVLNLIGEYSSYTQIHAAMVVPLALRFYEAATTHVVVKTYEDPQPLLKLLDAADGVVKHYGPGLSVQLKGFMSQLDEATSELLSAKLDGLLATVQALREDVNDH